MPAQPPFLTPTRTPAIGFSDLAMMALMRSAAASVSRITWGRGLAAAISFLLLSGFKARQRNPLHTQNNNEFPNVKHYHMFSVVRASSDIRLWSHGGSQTMFTVTR